MSSVGKITAEAIDDDEDVIPESTVGVDLGKNDEKTSQPVVAPSAAAPGKVSVRDMISKVNAKATVPPSGVVPNTGTRSRPTSRATTPTTESDDIKSGAKTTPVGDKAQPTSSPTALARKQPVTETASGKRPVSGRQLSPDKIAPFTKAGNAPNPVSSSKTGASSTSTLPKLTSDDVKPVPEPTAVSNKDVKPATGSTKAASSAYSFAGFSSIIRAATSSSRTVATPAATSTKTTPAPVTTTTATTVTPEVKVETTAEVKPVPKVEATVAPKSDAKAAEVAINIAKVEEAIYDNQRTNSTVGSKISELAGRFNQSSSTSTAQPSRSLSRPKRAEGTPEAKPIDVSVPDPVTTTTTPAAAVKPIVQPVKTGTLPWTKKTESVATPVTSTPTAVAVSSTSSSSSTASTTPASTTPAATAAKPVVGKIGAASWMKKDVTPAPVIPAKSAATEITGEMGEKKVSIKDRLAAMGGAAAMPFGVKPSTPKAAPVVHINEIIPTSKDGGISDAMLERYAGGLGGGEFTGDQRNKTSNRASIRLGARRQPTKRNMSVDDEEARAFSIIEDFDESLEADMKAAMEMKSEEDL